MDALKLLLSDYTFQIVALGTGFLGLLSGVIGTYATLRKQSLLGDALSHAALPGIGLAFLLIGTKELSVLLTGAAISGIIATFLIQAMNKNGTVKFDSALSIILASFFGLGLVILTYIQGKANANQAGLEKFIYGQASSMLLSDVKLIVGIGSVMLILVIVFWKELKVFTFNEVFAETLGYSTKFLQFLLSTMIVLTVILGLEAVGVILMSALLIGPAVAARQWSDRLSVVVVLAGLFGFLSGTIGTIISSIGNQIPTGPTIVLVLSFFIIVSLFLSPKRGLLTKWRAQRKREKEFMEKVRKIPEGGVEHVN